MSNKGKFIVIEGIDGSGKSSVAKALAQKLTEKQALLGQPPCLYEREPYDSDPAGRLVRASLSKELVVEPETMAYLNVASRIEHIKHLQPLLESGHSIVCDRFYPSNMAYNQTKLLSLEDIYDLNRVCLDMLRPDLILFLDVSVAVSKSRRQKDEARAEAELYEKDEIQNAVRNRFISVLNFLKDKEKIIHINAEGAFDEVLDASWNAVSTIL